MKEEAARVAYRVKGKFLAQLRDVEDMMGFNTPSEAAQYLAQRGLEVMTPQLSARKLLKTAGGQWAPSEMLPLLQVMMDGGARPVREAEKVP